MTIIIKYLITYIFMEPQNKDNKDVNFTNFASKKDRRGDGWNIQI